MSDGALEGVRVLELTHAWAGPYCAMMLGDMGAEIIKLEPPGGDPTHKTPPHFVNGESTYYLSFNRNKRSISVDLQTEEGQDIVRQLARKSDVVIQNFKFGGVQKFGLDYETLRRDNPGLVYCSITGYDSSGPEATRPGYDLVIQGESGLMALNGEPTQPPLKFGVAALLHV